MAAGDAGPLHLRSPHRPLITGGRIRRSAWRCGGGRRRSPWWRGGRVGVRWVSTCWGRRRDGEAGGGGSECVGAGECAALGGSGGGGDEGLDEFVRDGVQAVHCLCASDADPVQFGEFGGHGVGDRVGSHGVSGGGWWCVDVRHGRSWLWWCQPSAGYGGSVQSKSLLGERGRFRICGVRSVVRVSA